MRKLLVAVGVLSLSGCATTNLVGRSEHELIKKFGIPDLQMASSKGTIYQYVHCDQLSGPIFNMVVSSPYCNKRMFLVRDNIVIEDMGESTGN